ncbi:UNVERIFIED_CONTAM: Receptor expression-enhancing protein 6, partial [Eudyptes robustus]
LGLVSLYFIIGAFASIICNFVGFAYPAYHSVKALRTEAVEDDRKWLIYWTVFAFFSLVDFFANRILSYFPAYWLAKVVFLVYLYLPQTNGALYLYENYVDKIVSKFDSLLGF